MTVKQALSLKKGTKYIRDYKVLVRGHIREIDETGKWIQIQFSSYSLNIPVADVKVVK